MVAAVAPPSAAVLTCGISALLWLVYVANIWAGPGEQGGELIIFDENRLQGNDASRTLSQGKNLQQAARIGTSHRARPNVVSKLLDCRVTENAFSY